MLVLLLRDGVGVGVVGLRLRWSEVVGGLRRWWLWVSWIGIFGEGCIWLLFLSVMGRGVSEEGEGGVCEGDVRWWVVRR